MTEFDPQKALKEEIQGLGLVRESLIKTERRAVSRLAEAEEEHNAVTQVRGFLDAEIMRKRAALEAMEEAAKRNQ